VYALLLCAPRTAFYTATTRVECWQSVVESNNNTGPSSTACILDRGRDYGLCRIFWYFNTGQATFLKIRGMDATQFDGMCVCGVISILSQWRHVLRASADHELVAQETNYGYFERFRWEILHILTPTGLAFYLSAVIDRLKELPHTTRLQPTSFQCIGYEPMKQDTGLPCTSNHCSYRIENVVE
jgi:hypothetical protein